MLAVVSTIAFLAMVVTWAVVEPARARMSRTAASSSAKSQSLHAQSA
jgi:hypothetical protein